MTAMLAALFLTGLSPAMTGPIPQEMCTPSGLSPSFVMGQAGFEPSGRKIAIYRHPASTPLDWQIMDENNTVRHRGQTRVFGDDELSGDPVHQINFSGFTDTDNSYRLRVCGQESASFFLEAPDYQALASDSLAYFYMNRLAEPILERHVPGPQWARDAGFENMVLSCFDGQDELGRVWPGCEYSLDVTGGWADAGDYGQYVVNGGIAVWTLQHAYEVLGADPSEPGWLDQPERLPEGGNDISDLLDEAWYHLAFMMAMQIPDGGRVWTIRGDAGDGDRQPVEIDGSGLVHHKTHEAAWLPLPLLPEDAHETRYLYPPSTAASLNLAAAAAQCARLWQEIDADRSATCLDAARRAFDAAEREPDLYAAGIFDGGGPYGDTRVADEFAWAAAELFRTTDEERYRAYLVRWFAQHTANDAPDIGWAQTDFLVPLSLIQLDRADPLYTHAETWILERADRYLQHRDRSGYLIPVDETLFSWGSNGNLANRALMLAMAERLTGEARYRAGVVDAADYLLGRNALDQSYVSGWGRNAMQFAHHRFWAAGADPEFPTAPPGALSGGANNQAMRDPIAQEMEGECAAQRCWQDHVDAYALNEVAINWNAPLVWMMLYLHVSD